MVLQLIRLINKGFSQSGAAIALALALAVGSTDSAVQYTIEYTRVEVYSNSPTVLLLFGKALVL